jgi:S-adenosylhomocysteine hydrolase
MQKKVFPVPEKIDSKVAKLSLKYLQINIDKLNPVQRKYAHSY